MKPIRQLLIVLFLLSAGTGCGEHSETLFEGQYDQAEMDAAMEEARAHVDHFIEVIQSDPPESFAIKAAISDDENTEHFWMTDISYSDGEFTGELGNNPERLTNVKMGDAITVKSDEISDWLYTKGDKMYGNYTLRVMLPGMEPTEAIRWRQMLAPLPD